MDPARIVLLITDANRNSLAALAGALESTPATAELPIVTIEGADRLVEQLPALRNGAEHIVVAFSFGTLALIDAALAMARLKRCIADHGVDNTILVAGGAHPSAGPEETLKLGFDYVVVGEGEISFPALVAAVVDREEPAQIKGVASVRRGELVRNGRSERPDIDRFPPIGKRSRIFSYIESTRGCSRGCKFCHNTFFFGRTLRHRSIAALEDAVQFLHDIGWRDIHFLSPDALSYQCDEPDQPNLRAVEDLLRRTADIAGREHVFFGSFPSEIWPASVSGEALDIIKRHAANDKIIIGAQSGSQKMLDRMHRGHSVTDVVRAVDLILKWGFVPSVDFLFGVPGETHEEEEATIRLMRQLADKGAQIHSHTFVPLPGTPLAEAEPPRLSARLRAALDELAGPGKQYGSWQTQLEMAHRIHAFRKALVAVSSMESVDLSRFSD